MPFLSACFTVIVGSNLPSTSYFLAFKQRNQVETINYLGKKDRNKPQRGGCLVPRTLTCRGLLHRHDDLLWKAQPAKPLWNLSLSMLLCTGSTWSLSCTAEEDRSKVNNVPVRIPSAGTPCLQHQSHLRKHQFKSLLFSHMVKCKAVFWHVVNKKNSSLTPIIWFDLKVCMLVMRNTHGGNNLNYKQPGLSSGLPEGPSHQGLNHEKSCGQGWRERMAETGLTGQVNSGNSYRDDYPLPGTWEQQQRRLTKREGTRKGQAVPLGSSLPCLKGRLLGTLCIYKTEATNMSPSSFLLFSFFFFSHLAHSCIQMCQGRPHRDIIWSVLALLSN